MVLTATIRNQWLSANKPLSEYAYIVRVQTVLTNFRATSDEYDIQQHDSQHRKRKRKVNEDKAARAMREKDRERLEQQEARRKKLQEKLPSLEYAEGQHRIVVNDGKYENQGFVYVNKKIAPRIKQHQIEGLRFMWSQIVTDQEDMQGCLLAHTMGLGKTMQV